ncbi:MAG: glycosyltransferase [Microcella sp.]|uniref:glycosyltransferase n=1 Tax=Microcella sp. TaxID=1913979 RepID=UPI0024C8863E|nr:glycosyltransferase [Microcella sp.]UYN82578.1 MAG: glycosyltransferase [Microcella sp.]
MSGQPIQPSKRALVICYSPIASDGRVTNQIRWLEGAGYTVDVLSRGPEHPNASGKQFHIGYPSFVTRVAMHLFLTHRARFRRLISKHMPTAQLHGEQYDLVIVNDHHLLPWVIDVVPALAHGPVVLDLHEVYSGNGTSLSYRMLIAPYDDWLLTFLTDPVFTKHLTVAEGIANLYRDEFEITRPGVIRNVAPYEELEPSTVDPDHIVLVHHGYAAVERGIDIMLDAAMLLEPRFSLVLMVLGDETSLAPLRRHPAVAAGRARFRDPVGVTEVAKALNEYDLELIFFPPRFANNVYALPNKFFEAVQGRLGVVIGESPEIVGFVRDLGLGIVVDGWEASDLASALNSLTADQISAMKQASGRAAVELSTRGEGPRFLAEVGA